MHKHVKTWLVVLMATGWPANVAGLYGGQEETAKWPSHIQVVFDETEPLKYDRGDRLPLYLWQAMDPGTLDAQAAVELVRTLNERGVGLVASWNPGNRQKSLTEALTIARAQKKLGLRVNVNATRCLYSFFNGDDRTAHVDDEGKLFWDESFGKKKMGCPFALDFRRPEIREQISYFIRAFNEAELKVDFVFADWEIDGPIEFNEAHAASKRCTRCRQNIDNIEDFSEFQKALRRLRSELQREVYSEPMKENFPGVLVGNYGVYPHNGYRYWYDYYEQYVDGQPYQADRRAKYRQWYHEFPDTGYTFEMPVVYTWRRIFDWYDYANTDYRWFYNMLLVASNAGRNTPAEIPIISFVHWHTIETKPPGEPVAQLSETMYQELLWHMLLRGTDTFFLWCRKEEAAKEIRLVHQVYAQAQQYGEFLSEGRPIIFDVPSRPGLVISALRLGDRLLIRRTDFEEAIEPVEITVDGKKIKVESVAGTCRVLSLR